MLPTQTTFLARAVLALGLSSCLSLIACGGGDSNVAEDSSGPSVAPSSAVATPSIEAVGVQLPSDVNEDGEFVPSGTAG